MQATWIKRIVAIVVLLLIIGATVWALMPAPIQVDVAVVDRGPLEVSVNEEGVAQIADVFSVSAPISGKLERSPVRVGDEVKRDETTVAVIHPADPPFLDIRTRREIESAVLAAQAAVGLAEAELRSAEANERLLQGDLERAQRLATAGTISQRALEKAEADLDMAKAQVSQADAQLALRSNELVSAQAKLIEPDQASSNSSASCCMDVAAPVDGVVLKVLTESEQVVSAGTPLIEIGDPNDMEVVVHLLSSDAVRIAPGSPARITDWGGPDDLKATVRSIEPAAYTKVSALGIEEQRVDATLDLADPPEEWRGLGHEFRVMVDIAIWEGSDVLRVPLAALFRIGSDWTVYRVVDGHAVTTTVVIDHRNTRHAEVVDGLAEGDVVILHPSDQISDGRSVVARE